MMNDLDEYFPVLCPHCDRLIFSASAWSGPEPDCEPGILCPHCETFISDWEWCGLYWEANINRTACTNANCDYKVEETEEEI